MTRKGLGVTEIGVPAKGTAGKLEDARAAKEPLSPTSIWVTEPTELSDAELGEAIEEVRDTWEDHPGSSNKWWECVHRFEDLTNEKEDRDGEVQRGG